MADDHEKSLNDDKDQIRSESMDDKKTSSLSKKLKGTTHKMKAEALRRHRPPALDEEVPTTSRSNTEQAVDRSASHTPNKTSQKDLIATKQVESNFDKKKSSEAVIVSDEKPQGSDQHTGKPTVHQTSSTHEENVLSKAQFPTDDSQYIDRNPLTTKQSGSFSVQNLESSQFDIEEIGNSPKSADKSDRVTVDENQDSENDIRKAEEKQAVGNRNQIDSQEATENLPLVSKIDNEEKLHHIGDIDKVNREEIHQNFVENPGVEKFEKEHSVEVEKGKPEILEAKPDEKLHVSDEQEVHSIAYSSFMDKDEAKYVEAVHVESNNGGSSDGIVLEGDTVNNPGDNNDTANDEAINKDTENINDDTCAVNNVELVTGHGCNKDGKNDHKKKVELNHMRKTTKSSDQEHEEAEHIVEQDQISADEEKTGNDENNVDDHDLKTDAVSEDDILNDENDLEEGTFESEDRHSNAYSTDDVPSDLLTLYHSFGYECTKRSNLHLLSPNRVIFSTGNMFQILNMKTKKQINIRSTSGGGIGAIAVHPSRRFFAVSEKGIKPDIIIYKYPSLKIYRILREGTEAAYANLDFSRNGEKLASVGGAPDYMMTIWEWNKEQIVLRSKAFSQDVYKVAFSPENDGHLCSSGTGHIKFWTMANTFTGLKLQGELGRFGTTELSDISGFVELPDGKVLSGSEWGNMLLWDGGLIKVEISRKGKKSCHSGNIEQFFLDEGELITIGTDGYVKVWAFESIDTADALDESKLIELEPMSELKVGNDVKLLSMVKSVDEEESTIWYAQDGSGRIWKLDLSFSHTSQSPDKLFSYHAGKVSALALSPIVHIAATTGQDGTVRLFDYLSKLPLCRKKFNSAGCSLLWIPKIVDSTCSSILVGFSDGVVRHLSIVQNNQRVGRQKRNTSDVMFHLTQVFKPHRKAVTCLAIDGTGKMLATGSVDGTVFFFNIEKTIKPIGFVEIAAEIASLQWSTIKMGNKLLVAGRDGSIQEFSQPSAGKFDTTKSFQLPLPGLLSNKYEFKSIKDKLLKAEEDARIAEENAERIRRKIEEKARRKAQGLEEEDEENEESDEEDNEEEEKEKVAQVKHDQGNVLRAFYRTDRETFVITMDGWDAGYFYECSFLNQSEDSVKAIKIPDINDIPITSSFSSKNGEYLVFGLKNGVLRVQNMASSTLENLHSYWCINAHDNDYGAVSDIAISFDNKFLISTGEDGNIFAFSFMDEIKLKAAIDELKTKIQTKEIDTRPADDIDDPKHYSIELEKQKAEHDRMVRLAEEKKQQVKSTVATLRRQFRKLKAKNAELPSYLQLPTSDFIIDPQMKVDLEVEKEEKIALLKKETAYESEKHKIALQKLQKRFKENIDCNRIIIHSFESEHTVSSYRASKLTEEFFSMRAENTRKMTLRETEDRFTNQLRKMSVAARARLGNQGKKDDFGNKSSKQPAVQTQKLEGKIVKVIEKAEQRKLKKLNRQKEWAELYKNKPDENYEDPEDIAAIKHAELTIGDFKLKTASDYVVPEGQRVNAEKKKAHLFELKVNVHNLKKNFNDRLLKLRERKISTIEQIKELTEELEYVQRQLPENCHKPIPDVPSMAADELPERNLEYTTETLLKFRTDVLKLSPIKLDDVNAGLTTAATEKQPSKTVSNARTGTEPRLRSISVMSDFSSIPRSTSSFQCDSHDFVEEEDTEEEKPSALETAIEKEEVIRLTFRRDELLNEIKEKLSLFDAELRLLRHDKVHLDTKLKNAELRQITLFEELVLLKDFEKRENQLAKKVMSKFQEKEEMEDKLDESKELVALKKEELGKLLEREKMLFSTFLSTIGDNNKFETFLTKVFKKKIKRAKKKINENDEDSDEEDSDDDYDSDEEGDSEDDDELDDTVCPPGCEQVIFDKICLLRERRLDLEDIIMDTKLITDGMKKEVDALAKKLKIVDSASKNASADLEAFQREKQQKLNELDVVVTLKLDQIQYVLNNNLPQDLSECLVFERRFFDTLQERIKELEKEKVKQKHSYRERRQQHVQMIRDKKTMDTKIKELEDKVQQIKMLKFGRLVDLEKLETVSVNRVAEELKEKLRSQEMSNTKEIVHWDKKIDGLQAELTKIIRENTKRLDTYTILHEQKTHLEQQLDSRQKNLGGEFRENRKTDLEERQRLVQLVQLQSQEIEALKDEIERLSRKGGHIMPPPRSSIPPQQDTKQ